jgi:hypothetical protein
LKKKSFLEGLDCVKKCLKENKFGGHKIEIEWGSVWAAITVQWVVLGLTKNRPTIQIYSHI